MLIISCGMCEKKFNLKEDAARFDMYRIEVWDRNKMLCDRHYFEVCVKCYASVENFVGLRKMRKSGSLREAPIKTRKESEESDE